MTEFLQAMLANPLAPPESVAERRAVVEAYMAGPLADGTVEQAATLGGLAFSNAGVALVHAMEYPVGGAVHVSHGAGNGLLLPFVMRFNLRARAEEIAQIGWRLGLTPTANAGIPEMARQTITAIEQLRKDIGIPTRLRDIGVTEEMLARVGQITRTLHDSLRELGLDKVLEKATTDIPDVRERLNYVARMTEQAAQRVLNATDAAIPMQERIDAGADEILNGWQAAFKAPFSEANYRDMATMTMQCLADMRNDTSATKQQLLDIMMAQDFQDLTGQVIRKVTDLAHNLEQQLVQLLIDYAPAEVKRESSSGLLNGLGIRRVQTPPNMVGAYYDRVGFRRDGSAFVLDLATLG